MKEINSLLHITTRRTIERAIHAGKVIWGRNEKGRYVVEEESLLAYYNRTNLRERKEKAQIIMRDRLYFLYKGKTVRFSFYYKNKVTVVLDGRFIQAHPEELTHESGFDPLELIHLKNKQQ